MPEKFTAVLVYGRLPLVFAGMLCAVAVMWTRSPFLYTLGAGLLFVSMGLDWIDGWFASRFRPHATLDPIAERVMDKFVYSLIFPLVAVGMMWRLHFDSVQDPEKGLLHAIFVLLVCVSVLLRDNFASFMRGFAERRGREPELREFTRLRTIVAAPVGALLYARAFYVGGNFAIPFYPWISWLGNLPVHIFFVIEILLLIINFGSIAGYCRKYGSVCLETLCSGDENLRRRILGVFPNLLTVMNALMGVLAVVFARQGQISEAYLMLIGAAVFDKLDGALARRLGLTEPSPETPPPRPLNLGSMLDDLADAVSFCIAPAWIFHMVVSGTSSHILAPMPAAAIAVFYALTGILRLVYYTLDRQPIPGFFKGMPAPAAALLVTAPMIVLHQSHGYAPAEQFWAIVCVSVMGLAGILMSLYPVRYLHLGRFMDRYPWIARLTAGLIVLFSFTPYFGHAALIYMLAYSASPLLIRPPKAKTTPAESPENRQPAVTSSSSHDGQWTRRL